MKPRTRLSTDQIVRAKRLHDTGFSYSAIGEILKVDKGTIGRLALNGWKPRQLLSKPAPFDLARYAEIETAYTLCKRYGVGLAQLNKWLSERGIKRPNMQRRNTHRPCPADFRREGRDVPRMEALKRWNVSKKVLLRWRRECGFPTPRADLMARRKAAKPEQRIGWVDRYFERRAA